MFVFIIRICNSENANKNKSYIANLDWNNKRIKDFSQGAASFALYFYLILSNFLVLY